MPALQGPHQVAQNSTTVTRPSGNVLKPVSPLRISAIRNGGATSPTRSGPDACGVRPCAGAGSAVSIPASGAESSDPAGSSAFGGIVA